jgi:hypothetical protein
MADEIEFPTSADSHNNPKRARRNLENMLPEHWKMEPVHDEASNMEYGDDWIVKVTNKANKVFGAAFYIQSKVKSEKRVGRRIGIRLKPSTLNYLHNLMLPVLLHCYNPDNNTGYWLWLSDYSKQEDVIEWKGKKPVTVYIPTKNVLDGGSAEQILRHVSVIHRHHMLQKNAKIKSRTDQNFSYEFIERQGVVGVGVYAKHPRAIEEHPISVTFDLPPEDQHAYEKAQEMGDSFRGEAEVTFNGIPSWLLDSQNPVKMNLEIYPLVPVRKSNLRITYLDRDGHPLFKTNRVELELEKQGTKYQRWQGKPQSQPIIYTVIFDALTPQTALNFKYDLDSRSATALNWYINLLDTLQATCTVSIENLDLDKPPYMLSDYKLRIGNLPDDALRKYASALATLSTMLQVELLMPNSFEYDDLVMAESVVELLETGVSNQLTVLSEELRNSEHGACLVVVMNRNYVEKLFQELADEGYLEIPMPIADKMKFLGTEIRIGSSQYICYCTDILNRDEALKALESPEQSDDATTVQIVFALDDNKSYVQMLNVDQSVGVNEEGILPNSIGRA